MDNVEINSVIFDLNEFLESDVSQHIKNSINDFFRNFKIIEIENVQFRKQIKILNKRRKENNEKDYKCESLIKENLFLKYQTERFSDKYKQCLVDIDGLQNELDQHKKKEIELYYDRIIQGEKK